MLCQDKDKFEYKDLYYISDIKDELNRICSADNVKKVTITRIWELLVGFGLTFEDDEGGIHVKKQTDRGRQLGIVTVNKVSQSGMEYTLLMYPEAVQRMIVDALAELSLGEPQNRSSKVEEDDEVKTYKVKKKKYSEWVEDYPECVVIRKEGVFYTVRGDGARIIEELTDLNLSESDNPVTGTPGLQTMTNALLLNEIDYIVVEDEGVKEQKTFPANRYHVILDK